MPACLALWIVVLLVGATPVQGGELTAREYFRMLPATIFENTPEGLPEEEKLRLLETGRTEFWELRRETDDLLTLASLPFGESGVMLRVFRNEGEGHGKSSKRTLLALGTTGSPLCTLELWRADASGRIVPVDTPDEPSPKDYFSAQSPMPPDVRLSILFCVEEEGLEAVPVFWNESGMLFVPVQNRVHYGWRDGQFKKYLTSVTQ